jgi:hypothetical protein
MATPATTTGQRTNISTGALNGRGFTSNIQTPYYVQLVQADGSIEIVDSLTGNLLQKNYTVPTVVAALNQATLATAAYADLFPGATVLVQNYNATGSACSIQKIAKSTISTFTDWRVLSTADAVDTGAIAANPI